MKMLLSNKIEGFPYPERACPYCERQLTIKKAIHAQDEPQIYKVVFFCMYSGCGAYDEAARQCYARVYYSCPEAERLLYEQRIWLNPMRKD